MTIMDANVKSTIPTMIRLAKEEQTYLKQLMIQNTTRLDIVKKVVELLEGPIFTNSIPPPSAIESIRIRDPVSSENGLIDEYDDYPKRGSRQEKIKYILAKKGVALLSIQIQDLIREIEGPARSKETLRNFYNTITKMATSKEVLSGQVSNRRYTFFILPEFLDGIGRLKEEHYPDAKSFGSLDENQRNKIIDCFLN
jgi:hypothetical protein